MNLEDIIKQKRIEQGLEEGPEQGAAPVPLDDIGNFRQALTSAPSMTDYHPSRFRDIISRLGGAAVGSNNPQMGRQVADSIRNAPFYRRQQAFQNDIAPKQQLANLEMAQNAAAVNSAYRQAMGEGALLRGQALSDRATKMETPEERFNRTVAGRRPPSPVLDRDRGMMVITSPEGETTTKQYAQPRDRAAEEDLKFKRRIALEKMKEGGRNFLVQWVEKFRVANRRDPNEKEMSIASKQVADQMALRQLYSNSKYKDLIANVGGGKIALVGSEPKKGPFGLFGGGEVDPKLMKEAQSEYQKIYSGLIGRTADEDDDLEIEKDEDEDDE